MRLAEQRCFNHGVREAVARCPECRQFFCRECISEHAGRVLCARCLAALAAAPPRRRHPWLAGLARLALALFGLVGGFLWFYQLGSLLLAIPASFHEGSLWF